MNHLIGQILIIEVMEPDPEVNVVKPVTVKKEVHLIADYLKDATTYLICMNSKREFIHIPASEVKEIKGVAIGVIPQNDVLIR